MKPKKFIGRLTLNKKTIANLNGNEMSALKGGQIFPTEERTCLITCIDCMTDVYSCVDCDTHYLQSCYTWACAWSCPCDTGVEDGR